MVFVHFKLKRVLLVITINFKFSEVANLLHEMGVGSAAVNCNQCEACTFRARARVFILCVP